MCLSYANISVRVSFFKPRCCLIWPTSLYSYKKCTCFTILAQLQSELKTGRLYSSELLISVSGPVPWPPCHPQAACGSVSELNCHVCGPLSRALSAQLCGRGCSWLPFSPMCVSVCHRKEDWQKESFTTGINSYGFSLLFIIHILLLWSCNQWVQYRGNFPHVCLEDFFKVNC